MSAHNRYTGEGFAFTSPQAALEKKGFTVLRWTSTPPLEEFEAGLKQSCQLWVVSGSTSTLTPGHLEAIKKLVAIKKGLFLWADNDPYTADANAVLAALPETAGLCIAGNYIGDQQLAEATDHKGVGFTNHLTTTGLESLYEGITISTMQGERSKYRSLIRSSDGEVVTACHDRNRARIIIDGGFTRLLEDRWARTAGTSRFVTNAACWLYNWEGRAKGKVQRGASQGGGGVARSCKFGTKCVRFGCTFVHPHGRANDCRKGAACSRAGCKFLHPKSG